MKKIIPITLAILFFTGLSLLPLYAEEGMFPLSEIHKLDLKAWGFRIEPRDIYNPSGVSLIDGIINLGGCTASFVSGDGLILTNYHCAFGAVQAVTTPENDYLRDGFFAADRSTEIPAKRYTVRLIESYRDVSREILAAVKRKMTTAQRSKAMEEKINRMVVAFEKGNPGKRAEVAEMFRGKTYVLFVYNYIKDVRLVYAPPRSIGEFGGEEDNWMWPRHTGDFAFMRAYVAPDGSNAEFAPQNVPFRPKKYLKVAAEGVKNGDFAFILGYPGSTHRHKSSHFIAHEEKLRMPFTVDLYRWIIQLKEKMSSGDRGVAIKLSSSLKGLWNTVTRSLGQLQGLKNLHLVEKREKEEESLQQFITADPVRQKKYGSLLADLAKIYEEKNKRAPRNLTLSNLLSNRISLMMGNAFRICEASYERVKEDTKREASYMDRNFDRTQKQMTMALRDYHEPTEKALLKEMLRRAAAFKGEQAIAAVRNIMVGADEEKAIDAFLEKAFGETKLKNPEIVSDWLKKNTAQLQAMNDPFINLAFALYPDHREMKEDEKNKKGLLDQLLAKLVDVKKEFIGRDFIPDANSTLRLTYGRIRGYSPADAVRMVPFTTLSGIVEKHYAHPDLPSYQAPAKLIDLAKAKNYGRFAHPDLGDVPVAMLYNMDTTGGNSGSPVLNARGELIGLNFDRVFEATINDYAWDESYSRSIGVDIRFILWSLAKFSGADRLLSEMGVQ
ncbi:MAG TPA: S46 family peptidase [Patescibacteria group bacterium]|nr:S46 family peptidase [Patescibacteria group bacterium]